MKNQLISVIVPCYNQAEYLDECLQSVLDQTYQNWECIIVNDGSTDTTEDVALKWIKKDCRFFYLRKVNGGAGSARNLGIDNSKGEWIQFLDGDDIILPSKLQVIDNLDESVNFVYCDFQMLVDNQLFPGFSDMSKYELNSENLIRYWDEGFNIPIHCPIFNRNLIDNICFINEFRLHEDWLFWLTIFVKNKVKVRHIEEPLSIYRNHKKSTTKNNVKLKANLYSVYIYAYNNIILSDQKGLLFESILSKYTNLKYDNNILINQLDKLYNNKYFKLRKLIYKIFKL